MSEATKAPRPMSPKLLQLVATGAAIGYAIASGYADAVTAVKAIGVRNGESLNETALKSLGTSYVQGYTARYIEQRSPATAKRWHNMDVEQKAKEALAIIAKPTPTETRKPGQRTELEHKAVRAAQKSWALVKREAGIEATKGGGRAPRQGSNDKEEPPRDMLFASPKLANDNESRDYFRNAFAALLTTCEVNKQTGIKKETKHVVFLVESIIADAKAAIEKALA